MSLLGDLGLGRRTLVMGVLNVTPDSFSDGGLYAAADVAVEHAAAMVRDGADIIDVGGESTRPATFRDKSPLDPAEEARRILPVIARLHADFPEIPISVDTYKPRVAEAALDAGASILNDVSGLAEGPAMAELAARRGVPIVIMHIPGLPRDIPRGLQYEDVGREVCAFLQQRAETAEQCGVPKEDIVLDPGFGFGKGTEHNLELIRRLPDLKALGYPVLVGPSRKRFLGCVTGVSDPMQRREATAAAVTLCIAGGADIVRVHDVREMARVVKVADAVVRGWSEAGEGQRE